MGYGSVSLIDGHIDEEVSNTESVSDEEDIQTIEIGEWTVK